jgi:hypothetical protein
MRIIPTVVLSVVLVTGLSNLAWSDGGPFPFGKDYAVNLPSQLILTEPRDLAGDDPLCQVGLECTSFQLIEGTEVGLIKVKSKKGLRLFFSFAGVYNCDGCAPATFFPFVDASLLISSDGGPFEFVSTTSIYVPNSGTNGVLTRVLDLGRGEYELKMVHRYTDTALFDMTDPGNPVPLIVMGFHGGTVRLERLGSAPHGFDDH